MGIGDWRFEKKMASHPVSLRWIKLNEHRWISFGERSGDCAKRSTTRIIAIFWTSQAMPHQDQAAIPIPSVIYQSPHHSPARNMIRQEIDA
jgi:hypothetical protein